MPVIGFLNTASPGAYTARVRAFHQGLSETGYAEGRNVAIAYRWAEAQSERLPGLAADLVAQRVAVITVANIAAALAAKAVTDAIPIVFSISVDPVEVGLVASLNRPGGNITGATTLSAELGPKRLELLHEVIPTASKVAFLVNPTAPIAESLTRDMQEGAAPLGCSSTSCTRAPNTILIPIFATLSAVKAGALVISVDPFFNTWSERLAQLASRYAVPAIYSYPEFTAAGGLMSYGGSFTEAYRLAGVYTGRILNGEKPADLPVQQATKVELIINLKTARALVRRGVAVIASPISQPTTLAAKAATATIPIVFGVGLDPVKIGLVASLARPGGNATGINFFASEVVTKRLGLLHDLVPKAVRIAVLVNPANVSSTETSPR
jgi:putative tryptophan/tyrosine transport system substrate-binding protein